MKKASNHRWLNIMSAGTMYLIFLYTIVFIICIYPLPGQNESSILDSNNKDKMFNSIDRPDSVPFRFLPYNEQLRLSESYHQYNNIKLKLYEPGCYQMIDYDKGIQIREDYPGILTYTYLGTGQTKEPWGSYKIELYSNENNQSLTLDLRNLSPYKNYSNLEFGFPNREYIEDPIPENDNCNYKNLPIPDSYTTVNEVSVSPGGHIAVEFKLFKLSGNLLVGEETTLIIYNKSGKEISRINSLYETRYPFVSTDGKYLAYLFGGDVSASPFGHCKPTLEIYSLDENKNIYRHQFAKTERIVNLVEMEKSNFLVIGFDIYDKEYTDGCLLIDLNNREIHKMVFSKSEWNNISKNFAGYLNLLNKKGYETFKF